jgi:hypothetical protein
MSSTPLSPESADDRGQPPNVERLLHEEVRFEGPDIGTWRILAVLVGIVLVFVGTGLACMMFLKLNQRSDDRASQQSQYNAPDESPPAGPRLEPLDRSAATASTDVFAKQLAMERTLHSYGNTPEPGFVHVPIEQAMKLVAPTLPVRPGDARPPAKGFGLVDGGETNSGRLYSEAPVWLRTNK